MSNYDKKLLVSVEHSDVMHKMGLEFGRSQAFSEVISMLIHEAHDTGLDAAQAVIDMHKLEIEANKGENDE